MGVELVRTGEVEFGALDTARRMVSGLLVEWGAVAESGGRRWRFTPGSLYWSAVNRIKLNTHHARTELVGVATELSSSSRGLHGTFRIAKTPEGDRALSMAADEILDGFSIEVGFSDDDVYGPDPTDRSVTLVRRGGLSGVALTGHPAFDEARVDAVAASRDQRLELRLTAEEAAGVRVAADRAGQSVSELVRRRAGFTATRPTYSLGASPQGFSLVRDLWVEKHPAEGDSFAARDRLSAHRQFEKRLAAEFATATTVTDPEVIPPGYLPLLASIEADRALFAASSKGDITSGAPFTVPANITETAVGTGAATHVEGTQPTEGTLAFTGATVTPAGISGTFRCTREIVDSSNPAIDALAFDTMREDWNRTAETAIFTELNGSNGQAGTITAGVVPSGAQARVSAGAALPADLRKALLTYGEVRKRRPRSVVASTRTSVAEALELLDSSTVPAGSEDMFVVMGCGVRMSPFITGVAAGDGDVFALGSGDLWCWSSPLLEFSYGERGGPAFIDLALWGYFATRLVKPQGLASIRHT